MLGAATLLHQMGANVSGSDMRSFPGLGDLVSEGIVVQVGHRVENIQSDVDLVVMSAAIPKTNVERLAADSRGIRVLKYAELIGLIMRERLGIAIAGTHGKSTTTALCAHLFNWCGLDPSFIVGACCEQLGGGAHVGKGVHFIVESCEYDRSFLQLSPAIAAILNIEPDHFDCYGDFDSLVEAFGLFAGRVDPDGLLVCCGDDACAVAAGRKAAARVETYGFSAGLDWRAVNIRRGDAPGGRSVLHPSLARSMGHPWGTTAFDVTYQDRHVLSARLRLWGLHNVKNALAAVAIADAAGVAPAAIEAALATFAGVSRRMTVRGQSKGVTIEDDYAHHPTEIRATLTTLQDTLAPKRTWVIFQPHQYSRTRHLLDELADSFDGYVEVIVADVYEARENAEGRMKNEQCSRANEQNVGSAELVARMSNCGVVARYVPKLTDITDRVVPQLEQGDLVVTMGAGDVWKVADELVARIV